MSWLRYRRISRKSHDHAKFSQRRVRSGHLMARASKLGYNGDNVSNVKSSPSLSSSSSFVSQVDPSLVWENVSVGIAAWRCRTKNECPKWKAWRDSTYLSRFQPSFHIFDSQGYNELRTWLRWYLKVMSGCTMDSSRKTPLKWAISGRMALYAHFWHIVKTFANVQVTW